MPSFRSERKNYDYPKLKFSKKNKETIINIKKNNDFESSNWVKITCKSIISTEIVKVVRQLEQLLFRYSKSTVNLQPINLILTDGRLEFHLKLTQRQSKILCKSYSEIAGYDIRCKSYHDLDYPDSFPQEWINVIFNSLKNRCTNKESGETEVNLSDFSKDPFLNQNGLILKLSNPQVMKHVLNIIKGTNISEITSLILSNNDIRNIYQLELFFEHCKVSRVDLSENKISRTNDFKFMAKNAVINLNLANNSFGHKLNPQQLEAEMRKLLPSLVIFNNKRLPASVVIAGDAPNIKKTLPETKLSDKHSAEHVALVTKFCTAFDNNRDSLSEFYSSDCVLSLSCSSSDMPNCYRDLNCNILKRKKSSYEFVKKGIASIFRVFSGFPKTKHIEETLNVEKIPLPESTGFMMTGAWIEHPEKGSKLYRVRPFSRTFVFHDGMIVQDHISLAQSEGTLVHKYKTDIDRLKEQGDFAVKYRDQLRGHSTETIEVVRQFKLFTGMTVEACLEFLMFVNNIDGAMAKFMSMKEEGTIPAAAYDHN